MKRIKIEFNQTLLYPIDAVLFSVNTPEEVLKCEVEPIIATVPGNVELDMQRAGLLPDLFFGTNILLLEKYELYDYWYKCKFVAPKGEKSGYKLVFDGIDTLSEVWLNGEKIGETDNMFIPHSFNLKDVKEENELWVRIKSPVIYAHQKDYETGQWGLSYNAESVHIRKAPHSFGWDICPRALGGGIFKDVYLEKENSVEIEDVYLHTLLIDHNGGHVRLSYDLKTAPTLYHNAIFELDGNCAGSIFKASEKVVFKHGTFNFTIPANQLKLWYPVGYGEQNLYKVTACVKSFSGEILAEKTFNFGVRTVEVDFDESGEEKKFLVKVNGCPIMIKGTNWVPLDAFHSNDANRMGRALELLKDCGANAVRCWGGNIYEPEEFFDFCDENGILVWQDVMMACNLYPSTDDFYKKLEKELKSVLVRIRKHPSLACYCGDNECDLGMFFNGINPSLYKVTRDYLPTLFFRFDPFRRFIPSSPFFAGKALKNRDEQALAENHLWGPRNNFKSKFYVENKNVFISEIGYHGCNSVESIKKFIPEKSLWHWENDDWMVHQTVPGGGWVSEWNRIKLMAYQVRELFGFIPDNLEDFSVCSQISQAEALKFFVEFTRLNKWQKSGILWWNLLDCWPQFSDAVVD
ncbi:MAG: glycoside hydrolase family 2, partial [Clostridia bacterium]|nr:glycoside hydrolase family 2 [Clostridia bacterium]